MKYIRLAKKIKINRNSVIRIPLKGDSVITFKVNDVIEKDTVLGQSNVAELLNVYEIDKILKVSKESARKYLNVINGEVVKKGDLIAKKSTFASLGYYDIVSDKGGIVDLNKIDDGKVFIYDHLKSYPIYPECNGIVSKIIPSEYIEIETSTLSFDLDRTIVSNDTYGRFVFIAKPNLEKSEYTDNIVFINSPLTSSLYELIKDKKPALAIFPTIDASFLVNNLKLAFPVCSYWGYSSKSILTTSYRNLIVKMNNRIANYSKSESRIHFPLTKNSIQDATKENSEYMACKVGEKIVSLSFEKTFEEAEVIEVFENECRVEYLDKKREDLSFDEMLALC